jgi:group I intron endonuclease
VKSGIYRIYSIETDESYYGSTKNFNCRFACHRYSWKTRKNGNKNLQKLYDKYGLRNFVFEILECCEIDKFEEREKYYLDKDDKKLNIWIYPFSPKESGTSVWHKMKGKKRPNCAHKHTEKTKKLLSEKTKQYFKKHESVCLGKSRSEEVRKKVSAGLKKYFLKNGCSHKGKPKSEETKRKISNTLKLRGLHGV